MELPSAPTDVALVITADWIVTVDPDDSVIADGAVAVHDGRVVGVGPRTDVLDRFVPTERVDLAGHVLMPGLVNAHTHLAMTMFRGLADDRNLSDFLARLLPAEAKVDDPDRVVTASRAGALESVCGGVTTALDMYYFAESAISGSSDVGLRLLAGPVLLDQPGPDHRRIADAGGWLDRNPARPGWRPMLGPHSTYLVSPELLAQVRDLMADHDVLLHVHASETQHEVDDVRARYGRTPIEHLADLGLLGPDTVLAHGVHLNDDEIAMIAASGAAVVHCPASNLKLAAGIARIPELLAAGATVAIGTDGAASSNDLDMFTAMRLTALLHKATSGDPTALPAGTVVRLATMGGARALGVDADLGSIEVGKLADLVAVDLDQAHTQPVFDPVSSLVYAAGRGDVRQVWVGGEQVVRDGEPTRVDRRSTVDALAALREVVLAAV